jgi:hypothetical protein
MWETSLPEDKLAGDLGNGLRPHRFGGRRSVFLKARKLAPGNLGLFQQHRSFPEIIAPQHCHPLRLNQQA